MENEALHIIESCEKELVFKTSRSGGSGGQHVNKVETKVTLRWNIEESDYLSQDQKGILFDKLKTQVNKEGELVIHSEAKRSQLKNKELVIEKWKDLIHKAFIKKKKRKPTKISKTAKEKRRKAKTKKSVVKDNRKKPKVTD